MSKDKTNAVIRSVWDDHSNEDWRKDRSHYRGSGRWEDDSKWQAIGKKSFDHVKRLKRYGGTAKGLTTAKFNFLEWGPGGGANLFGFRDVSKKYYGIDISQKNIDESIRMIEDEGYANLFSPILLEAKPGSIVSQIDDKIDVFLSTAVFQHFPSKKYGYEVLRAIRMVSGDDAVGFIQIRYDNGDPNFAPNSSLEEYSKRVIRATSYGLDEFWVMCVKAGFRPLAIVDLVPHTHYATFHLKVV